MSKFHSHAPSRASDFNVAPIAGGVYHCLENNKQRFGIIFVKRGRTSGSKGRTHVKVRSDGNGGVLVTTNEPNAHQEFWISCPNPPFTIKAVGEHLQQQRYNVMYK